MANRLTRAVQARRTGVRWPTEVAAPDGLPARTRPPAEVDLEPRRRELSARVAELQWDLGGLVYEMATRDHIRVDLIVARAAVLQEADAELGELERVLRVERGGAAGACPTCDALHSRGAAYCWRCGTPLVAEVPALAPAQA